MKSRKRLEDHLRLGELYPVVLPCVLLDQVRPLLHKCLHCLQWQNAQARTKRKGYVALDCAWLRYGVCGKCIAWEPVTIPADPVLHSC